MTASDIAARLPGIDVLRERCRALAVLETIMDDGEPYYAYSRDWGDAEAGFMNNGSGDEWAVVFAKAGAVIRALNPEAEPSRVRRDVTEIGYPVAG